MEYGEALIHTSGVLTERGKETPTRQTQREEFHVMTEAEIGVVPGEKKHGNLPLSPQEGTTLVDTSILNFKPPKL